jgi:hypothetical protein
MTARVETRAEDGAMHIAVSGEIDLANAAAVETRSGRRFPTRRKRCQLT